MGLVQTGNLYGKDIDSNGASERDIKKICSQAHVAEGLAICGSSAGSSQQALKTWLAANGISV